MNPLLNLNTTSKILNKKMLFLTKYKYYNPSIYSKINSSFKPSILSIQNKIIYKFSTTDKNLFIDRRALQNNAITKACYLKMIQNNDNILKQIAQKYGQKSLQYVNKLCQLALRYQNMSNKIGIQDNKWLQYNLKCKQLLSQQNIKQNQQIKTQIDYFIIQIKIGSAYSLLGDKTNAIKYYQQFLNKLLSPSSKYFKKQLLNFFQFMTYKNLIRLYQQQRNHQLSQIIYNKTIKLINQLNNCQILSKYQILNFYYSYAQFQYAYGNFNKGIQAIQELLNIVNYRKVMEIQILYEMAIRFGQICQTKVAVNILQRILQQIQTFDQPQFIQFHNYFWTFCLNYYLKTQNYQKQSYYLQKLINLYKNQVGILIGIQYTITIYLLQLSKVQIKLKLYNQSYITLLQAYQFCKSIKIIMQHFKEPIFYLIDNIFELERIVMKNNLDEKYLSILKDIQNRVKKIKL